MFHLTKFKKRVPDKNPPDSTKTLLGCLNISEALPINNTNTKDNSIPEIQRVTANANIVTRDSLLVMASHFFRRTRR